ncbi:hypothetical protein PCANC_17411 [Puccinia coronata f. sp. avenae]|uniref:V-ATPase proteolipid subunit C-like domain-containing protein n=1 Tax=Puccinia coronata f. sp. avenae TaxID=200324 RepID=A0A2N5SCF6_9BASI|nr:hypothetical protein PCANC_17411 [Puccinia coronata f. sp. avenae]
MPLYQGFVQLGAGLSVGLAGLSAGFAIGIVGDAGVRGTAQQPRLFNGLDSHLRRGLGSVRAHRRLDSQHPWLSTPTLLKPPPPAPPRSTYSKHSCSLTFYR